ncbi:PEP-CTERM sorting domain-containing protein [Nostoc sp. MS1]|uniref:PEP-CTERM sorting domain-containing protein n=1 Tax=Nostoc sp. MS1 TaxID=2764711 RepID=UPI001CC6809D|nr:PEP-CTERM sorting domain-containing protein [Nostoc sp. MS1]BCL35182.1 hypothetical protein NSMS1_16290 [Nostoc sp. MS1]
MKTSTILPILSAIALAPITVGLLEVPASALTLQLAPVDFPPPGVGGGTAFGSFDYNTATNIASNQNITTTAGIDPSVLPAFNYTTSSSTAFPNSDNGFFTVSNGINTLANDRLFIFRDNSSLRTLGIYLTAQAVNNTLGATYAAYVAEGNVEFGNLSTFVGNLIAGNVSADLGFRISSGTLTAVPEPITMAGLALGSGFGVLLRRKYKKPTSVSN